MGSFSCATSRSGRYLLTLLLSLKWFYSSPLVSQVLVPLLLQALYKYNLVSSFSAVVAGFCNTPEAISELGDKARITSLSLRSLCKTVLEDTSLSTASAVDR